MSQPRVRKLWHKFLVMWSVENLHGTGRPSKLTDRDRKVLGIQYIKEPLESAACIYMLSNIDKNIDTQ